MKDNFNFALKSMLAHEGGFSDLPADPGGMTMLGVTKATWEAYVGHPVGREEMMALTPEIVSPLYKSRYWDACRCDDLPSGLDYAVFDYAVNSGVSKASKELQRLVKTTRDGVIGPMTIAAVAEIDAADLIDGLCDHRLAYLNSLPTSRTFTKGWTRRVHDVAETAHDLI